MNVDPIGTQLTFQARHHERIYLPDDRVRIIFDRETGEPTDVYPNPDGEWQIIRPQAVDDNSMRGFHVVKVR